MSTDRLSVRKLAPSTQLIKTDSRHSSLNNSLRERGVNGKFLYKSPRLVANNFAPLRLISAPGIATCSLAMRPFLARRLPVSTKDGLALCSAAEGRSENDNLIIETIGTHALVLLNQDRVS